MCGSHLSSRQFPPLLLNRVTSPIFRLYGHLNLRAAKAWLERADVIVFESIARSMLLDQLKQYNPSARFVYRVSDDMRWLGLHPVCLEAENRLVPEFDLISSPSPALHERFSHLD